MNQQSRAIIREFLKPENLHKMRRQLTCSNESRGGEFIEAAFNDLVSSFVYNMRIELSNSEPLSGITIDDQVACYSQQFVADHIQFTRDDQPVMFTVGDGHIMSTVHARDSETQLMEWKKRPSVRLNLREDECETNPHYGGGITFCDQSDYGQQRHLELFYNPLVSINADEAYLQTPFGVSTPAADARLASRRIARFDAKNTIPRRKAMLCSRNTDRNLDSMRTERDCSLYKHDMTALKSRSAARF